MNLLYMYVIPHSVLKNSLLLRAEITYVYTVHGRSIVIHVYMKKSMIIYRYYIYIRKIVIV